MSKLTVIHERDDGVTVAKRNDGQLFVGRRGGTFMKLLAYSLDHNGEVVFDGYTLANGKTNIDPLALSEEYPSPFSDRS